MKTTYVNKTNIINGLEALINCQFEANSINPQFPETIENLGESDICEVSCSNRKDFRNENAMTIDCGDCKDMDDAVSVVKTLSGYRLAVHIADVATYVPVGSELDSVATHRATSIYLPGLTVPMLPKVLSNNLCSLNPGVDRNTLSVIADLDAEGTVINAEIVKGQIRSRVKGVYSEVNRILSGEKNEQLLRKYSQVMDELFYMAELYKLLRDARIKDGATVTDSNKPKISITKYDVMLTPTMEGVAENMIEEFMVLANRIVAEYLCDNDLPAIFRIQEEKNQMAAYQPVKMHHAELALESYSHFTSPIRRVADLKVHQILTMHLSGVANEAIKELFQASLVDVCDRATKRSRTVKQVQDRCERYCYEQFFKLHRDYTYTGTLVCFDKRNRPIVQINEYNIKIIGYALINGAIGDRYSFKVGVSNYKNEFIVSLPKRLAA